MSTVSLEHLLRDTRDALTAALGAVRDVEQQVAADRASDAAQTMICDRLDAAREHIHRAESLSFRAIVRNAAEVAATPSHQDPP